MNNCTGCHSTSYALQSAFDEAGWNKIIDLMKVVPVTGVYPGPRCEVQPDHGTHQKRLPPTSHSARGPGESSMKAWRVRAHGRGSARRLDALRLPLNPDAGHRHPVQRERRHRLVARVPLQKWVSCRTTAPLGLDARSTSPATTPTAA